MTRLACFAVAGLAGWLTFGQTRAAPPQDSPPFRILRGELLTWDVGAGGGLFSFLGPDSRIKTCQAQESTYYMSGERRIEASLLRRGATIEVVADMRNLVRDDCLALTVYLRVPPMQRLMMPARLPADPARALLDNLWGRGNLTFSGVVRRIQEDQIVLRVRTGQDQVLLLRADTAYSESGRPVVARELGEQKRVFVRGGKNLFGQVEAYHIMWGQIPFPPQAPNR